MGQTQSVQLYPYLNHFKWLTSSSVPTEHVEQTIESLGQIRGKTFTIDDGRRVNAFLGVPYATCGTFQDRFKKPQRIEPWEGIRDCTQFGPRSLQVDMVWDYFLTPIGQDEQCLHMNIFVPEMSEDEKRPEGRPVMVFVHGGGYIMHSSFNYGDRHICRNLCKHGVIVCVIQYRLGLLGFMSTGNRECPGNLGLYDQREAFLWIKQHIGDFGGNSNNVTAFGQSAGAASIDLLSISPHCKGLFKRIILMGGNAASDWAIGKPEKIVKAAAEVARKAGWKGEDTDSSDLLEFLRKLPAEKCKAAIFGKSAFNRSKSGLDFCPVIDEEFLPEPISELRKKAPKIEVVIGTTDFEALLFVAVGRRTQSDLLSFEKQLHINIPESVVNAEELREEARRLYLEGVDKSDRTAIARSFMRLYSDSLMNNSTHRYVEEMTSAGHEVYLYNFTHCNPSSFGLFAYRVPFVAATHCYELRYLFGKGMFAKFRPNSQDLKMIDIFGTMFTNYAKIGNPNYDPKQAAWKPVKSDNTYLHMDINTEPTFIDGYQGRRAEFWKKVAAVKQRDMNSNETIGLALE